jgi:hypothetical protein
MIEYDEMREHVLRLDDTVTRLVLEVAKLQEYDEFVNLTTPKPDSEAGDEFVRKELIGAYDSCELRDAPMLEYVIRMFSDPDQWKEFYKENDLKHYYIIGEAL